MMLFQRGQPLATFHWMRTITTSMPELSPAAQAVLDAFRTSHTGQGCLAAALHAAAAQLLAVQWNGQIPADAAHQIGINWACDALHVLANELKGQ